MGDPPERRARAQIRAVATLAIMDSEEVNGGWSVAGKPQKRLVLEDSNPDLTTLPWGLIQGSGALVFLFLLRQVTWRVTQSFLDP